MDLNVTVDVEGVPSVQIPALLDWLDVQISALNDAKNVSSENVGIYLDSVIESYQGLKDEMTATTLETMDANGS